MNQVTIQEFYDMCLQHDWYYDWSDDPYVYRNGKIASDNLINLSNSTDEHKRIYNAWREHSFSGKPWGTEQSPRPECPA